MSIERGILCRDCEKFEHLNKQYFPDEWTDGLVEEQFDPPHKKSNIQSLMAFMGRHEGHNIELINEHSSEWHSAIFEFSN